MDAMSTLGIIGGSGLDDPAIIEAAEEVDVETPYGMPSAPLRRGTIAGREVVILSRHGRRHTIPPSKINNRANIWALKQLGCAKIVATAACGSLREGIERGAMVLPDQFIDFTRHRAVSFYDAFPPGIENARHAAMADPFDQPLRSRLLACGNELGLTLRDGGVILTIEGPRFSTRAESRMFRAWGADLINMTIAPEAILANEAALPYAVVAVVTDYDCWKEDEPPLRVDDLVAVFNANVDRVTRVLLSLCRNLAD